MNTFCRMNRQVIENIYCCTSEQTAQECLAYTNLYTTVVNGPCLEVPFEQYEEIITYLDERLPNFDSSKMIKRGAFTYQQLKHIVEAGNIRHLQMNEEGRIAFVEEFISMSSAIAFAQSKWNGAERLEAVENSVYTGLSILGKGFAEDVISIEVEAGKMQKDVPVEQVVKKLTDEAKRKTLSLKKKCLYKNDCVATGAYVTDTLSTDEINSVVKEQLSPTQLYKTAVKTSTGIVWGLFGALIGSGIGYLIPNVSTTVISFICAIIGLVGGSRIATNISKKILCIFVQEDALRMLEIFKQQVMQSSEEFLLSKQELEQALHDFNTLHDLPEQLRKMSASDDPKSFAKQLIENELIRIVRLRMYLHMPMNTEIYEVLDVLANTKRKGAVA